MVDNETSDGFLIRVYPVQLPQLDIARPRALTAITVHVAGGQTVYVTVPETESVQKTSIGESSLGNCICENLR